MATPIDSLFFNLGINTKNFDQGIKGAEQRANQSAMRVANTGLGIVRNVASTVARLALPIMGAFSIAKILGSYQKDVAEVARMTGQYSQKLEEWKLKRAQLSRITQEDIKLYKQNREAVVKFQIAMGDLSAKIGREFAPVQKMLIDGLNKFSDWISRNEHNIIRFLEAVAIVIGGTLVTSLIACRAAWMAFMRSLLLSPLAPIVAALMGLTLLIDDLMTYLEGGDSLLGGFWGDFIEFCKNAKNAIVDFWDRFVNSEAVAKLQAVADRVLPLLTNAFYKIRDTFAEVWDYVTSRIEDLKVDVEPLFWMIVDGLADLYEWLEKVGAFDVAIDVLVTAFKLLGESIKSVFAMIEIVWGALVAAFTGDFTLLERGWDDLCAQFMKVFDFFYGYIKQVWDQIVSLFDFSGLMDKARDAVGGVWNDLKGFFGFGGDSSPNANAAAPTHNLTPSVIPIVSRAMANNSNMQNNNNNITIYTNSDDPYAVGQAAQNGMIRANNTNYAGFANSADSGVYQ